MDGGYKYSTINLVPFHDYYCSRRAYKNKKLLTGEKDKQLLENPSCALNFQKIPKQSDYVPCEPSNFRYENIMRIVLYTRRVVIFYDEDTVRKINQFSF